MLVRALVLFLAAWVSLGPATGFATKLLAGEHAHVCHCEVRGGHATCACPICIPSLRDDDDHVLPTFKGTCGDDDPLLRHAAEPMVLPAMQVVAVLPWLEAPPPPAPSDLEGRSHDPPEPRPPRARG